jgi:gephyrin
VVSPVNVPSRRISIVDGYAVSLCGKQKQQFTHSQNYSVAGTLTAGIEPTSHCIAGVTRISTGAVVPDYGDAVVMVEDTNIVTLNGDGEEQSISINAELHLGDNIRPIGCDISKGEVIMKGNTLISDLGGDLGSLISCGVREIRVIRRPFVAIFSTGDEICDFDLQSGENVYGSVYDTNRPCLKALLSKYGYDFHDFGIVKDKYLRLLL